MYTIHYSFGQSVTRLIKSDEMLLLFFLHIAYIFAHVDLFHYM